MRSRCLNILIYHRVMSEEQLMRPGEVDIKRFDAQMKWVARFFNVIDLQDAVGMLKSNTLPPRALSITFDDGYKDNYLNALPVLKRHGLTATFFIATGFLNGGIMWNDVVIEALRSTKLTSVDLSRYGLGVHDLTDNRLNTLNGLIDALKYLPFDVRAGVVDNIPSIFEVDSPADLMMSDADVKGLFAQNMSIGGHTENHPILAKIASDDARREIERGKEYLENITESAVELFAYPNGKPAQDYLKEHVELIRDIGFKAAVSTAWGVARTGSDVFQLPRFTPWDRSTPKYLARLARTRFAVQEARA